MAWPILFVAMMTAEVQAVIHKRTESFLDLELPKDQFLIDCEGETKDKVSIVGFHLLDGDTYYLFYYRGIRTTRRCRELRKEYMEMLKNQKTVRIVGNHPDERLMIASDRKTTPAPFNRAKRVFLLSLSVFRRVVSARPIFQNTVIYLKIIGAESCLKNK